MEARS
jgi:hypothetical protein